jgi:hypothetical protein
MLQDTFVVPRILRWLLDFWKICAPLLQMMWKEAQAHPSLSKQLLLTFVWKDGYWLISCTTKSMEQRFYSTADAYLTNKEIPCLSKKPKVHYRTHNSPPLDSRVCHIVPPVICIYFTGTNSTKIQEPPLVRGGASFAPRTQNIEEPRYIIYSPGGDLAPGIRVPLSHPTFYISIVPNRCMLPLGFPTKTLYAVMEKPV